MDNFPVISEGNGYMLISFLYPSFSILNKIAMIYLNEVNCIWFYFILLITPHQILLYIIIMNFIAVYCDVAFICFCLKGKETEKQSVREKGEE